MTHLPYIIGSYGLTVTLALAFSISAAMRLSRARRKLAAIDPRAGR